ncbi:protein kinase, putative [Trichomonas vaginalis G3]|uniref:Protein kinase, putative n=1 Tax=Trichomonas vaginalis (strain ATCC PRA-98 / G3) TaxID=412133 RepID=A2F5L4_TRIV3|nr:MAP kinase kinase kinase protein [Trichomonas vaginalis G3]EAX99777.1 protein kinase, putative [Trichomonas vaginalis G3]KAI5494411.1 MAP kinase kinase kinase protein [Trichomonas vaginalis G3]|eukprot:XP_001312707.1 protein kinase [Trichomonas vaginalis G3]
MEFCPSDLSELIRDHDLSDYQLQKYCCDILKAIKACHDQHIAHNDIKLSNFLIDRYGRLKCCDFGLSAVYDSSNQNLNFRGTMLYMAPEIFNRGKYNPLKADIWSIGVTFFIMATHFYPFFAMEKENFIQIVKTGNYPMHEIKNLNLRKVIIACLQLNPDCRPTVDELLGYDFFKIDYGSPNTVFRASLLAVPGKSIIKPALKKLNNQLIRSKSTLRLRNIPIPIQ